MASPTREPLKPYLASRHPLTTPRLIPSCETHVLPLPPSALQEYAVALPQVWPCPTACLLELAAQTRSRSSSRDTNCALRASICVCHTRGIGMFAGYSEGTAACSASIRSNRSLASLSAITYDSSSASNSEMRFFCRMMNLRHSSTSTFSPFRAFSNSNFIHSAAGPSESPITSNAFSNLTTLRRAACEKTSPPAPRAPGGAARLGAHELFGHLCEGDLGARRIWTHTEGTSICVHPSRPMERHTWDAKETGGHARAMTVLRTEIA